MFVGTGIDDFGALLQSILILAYYMFGLNKLLKILTFRNICSALFKSKFLAEKEKWLS